MGSVAKSYMRKGFLIYEEMRKYLTIYEEAISHVWLGNRSLLNFNMYEENLKEKKNDEQLSITYITRTLDNVLKHAELHKLSIFILKIL